MNLVMVKSRSTWSCWILVLVILLQALTVASQQGFGGAANEDTARRIARRSKVPREIREVIKGTPTIKQVNASIFGDNDFFRRIFLSYVTTCNVTADTRCCSNRSIVEWMYAPEKELEPCLQSLNASTDPGACLGGFFKNKTDLIEQCPPGRFCPTGWACLMGCSMGGFCPVAPKPQKASLNTSAGQCLPGAECCNNMTVAYKTRYNESLCAGAIGEIMCPSGYYCPNSTTLVPCPEGHYCRGGNSIPQACSVLSICPQGTTVNSANYTGGIVLVLIVVVVLITIKVAEKMQSRKDEIRQRQIDEAETTERSRIFHIRRKSFDDLMLSSLTEESPQGSPIEMGSPLQKLSFHTGRSRLSSVESSADAMSGDEGTPPKSTATKEPDFSDLQSINASPRRIGSPRPSRVNSHARSISTPAVIDKKELATLTTTNSKEAEATKQIVKAELKRRNVQIVFEHLGLELKKKGGKRLLDDVSGVVEGGKITAVMGPSGAGKTTLVNVLLGKAHYGRVTGRVLINEIPQKLSTLRREIGFVPQDDVMHTTLTVREVLSFQARLRLPIGWSSTQIRSKVDEVLSMLEIEDIQNSVIGDIENRGISGGQRKRVNIGMELVTDPSILALDEPTSGLDATSGLRVVEVLQKAARQKNLTVLTVLHQPRHQIFRMFDHLLLLAGGKTVYEGATRHAVRYFENHGYKMPKTMNPADFLLDVISDVIQPVFNKQPSSSLHDQWVAYAADRYARIKTFKPHGVSSMSQSDVKIPWWKKLISGGSKRTHYSIRADDCAYETDAQLLLESASIPQLTLDDLKDKSPIVQRDPRSCLAQFKVFFIRETVLHLRNTRVYMVDAFLTFMGAVLLGTSHRNVDIYHLLSLYTLGSIVAGIVIIIPTVRILGTWKSVYYREASSGINRLAYFTAANIAHIPILLLMSIIYFTAIYTFTTPRTPPIQRYAYFFCEVFAVSGIGYFVSVLFQQKSFQMAAVVLVLANGLIDGVSPSYATLMTVPVIGPTVLSVSYARWMVQVCFYQEMKSYPLVYWRKINHLLAIYGQEFGGVDHSVQCVIALLLMGLAYRIVAFGCLALLNRAKQR